MYVNYFLQKEQRAKRSVNVITAVDLVVIAIVLISSQINGFFATVGSINWVVFLGILVLVNLYFFVDYFYSYTSVKKEKYRQAYLEENMRFVIVGHVYDINKTQSPIMISDIKALQEWFYSKLGIGRAFRDDIAMSVSLVPGCYRSDLGFADNVESFLAGHPIQSVYFESIESFNGKHGYVVSSKRFGGEPEDGFTVMFVCETSKVFFDEVIDARLKGLSMQKNNAVIALGDAFDCNELKTQLVAKLEYLPLPIA